MTGNYLWAVFLAAKSAKKNTAQEIIFGWLQEDAVRTGLKISPKIVLVGLVVALLLSSCAFSRSALVSSWKEKNFRADDDIHPGRQAAPDPAASRASCPSQYPGRDQLPVHY